MKENIVVSIDGSCRSNPHGEMGVAYIIEFQDAKTEVHQEYIDAKRGNTMITAEYISLNKALERLIDLNMTRNDIQIKTTSSMILMHVLGHFKPSNGYYVKEALATTKKLKRFLKLNVSKVLRKENMEVVNLLKKQDNEKLDAVLNKLKTENC